MSELANLLARYGYGEPQPEADTQFLDTRNVLAGIPKPNPLVAALRSAMQSIPENKELPNQHYSAMPSVASALGPVGAGAAVYPAIAGGASMLNMVRGGLDTAANWLDYRNKLSPQDYKPSDTLAPLGAGLMGSAFAPQNALGIFGGRLAKGGELDWKRIAELESKLNGDFAHALDEWVGGGKNAAASGLEGGIMMPHRLEALAASNYSDTHIDALRSYIRGAVGDHMTAYRGTQPHGQPTTGRRDILFSYTTDPNVAARYAGVQTPEMPILSDAQIRAAENALRTKGEVSIGGKTFRKGNGEYIDMYDRAGNFITDTDSLVRELANINEYMSDLNKDRAAALSRVEKRIIPIDDIFWATNRFNQREIIAKRPKD